MPTKLTRTTIVCCLGVIALIGMSFRVYYLQHGITYDEAYNYLSYSRETWLNSIAKYNLPNHLFNSLVIYWSQLLFGESLLALRAPAFASGLGIIVITPWIWFQLLSTSTVRPIQRQLIAIGAAFLTAVSFRMIHYSVEARGYALQTLLFLVSVWAAERTTSEQSKRWPILYALTSTLAIWTVLIHLYALCALGLWMLARLTKENSVRILKAQLMTAVGSAIVYSPVALYVATKGTKIEGSEPWSSLLPSITLRMTELMSYWRQDMSTWFFIWLLSGTALALFVFWRKIGYAMGTLAIALVAGPVLVFIVTKRPAPFERVWTYLLPMLFGYAWLGWVLLVEKLRSFPARFVLVVALSAPAFLFPVTRSMQNMRNELKSFQSVSAEPAWRKMVAELRPGDTVAFEWWLYDMIRCLALIDPRPNFKLEPILRQSSGNLTVIQQNGRLIAKSDPLDPSKPGRALLYANRQAQIPMMLAWLKPYVPAGKTLSEKTIWQNAEMTGDFPRLIQFELSN